MKEADKLWLTVSIYYITGPFPPETGAPTALMELAYRLAVDNSAYVKFIREHLVTLITPVVEVDGRNRMVDVYKGISLTPTITGPISFTGDTMLRQMSRAIGYR